MELAPVVVLLSVAVVALAVLAGVLGACVLPLWWRVFVLQRRIDDLTLQRAELAQQVDKLDAACAVLLEWRETFANSNGRVVR